MRTISRMQNTTFEHNQQQSASIAVSKNGTPGDTTAQVQAFTSAASIATAQQIGGDNRAFAIVGHAQGQADITFQTTVSGANQGSEIVRATVTLAPDQYTLVVTLGPVTSQ